MEKNQKKFSTRIEIAFVVAFVALCLIWLATSLFPDSPEALELGDRTLYFIQIMATLFAGYLIGKII